jgi:hypothetical protein
LNGQKSVSQSKLRSEISCIDQYFSVASFSDAVRSGRVADITYDRKYAIDPTGGLRLRTSASFGNNPLKTLFLPIIFKELFRGTMPGAFPFRRVVVYVQYFIS